MKLGTQVRLVRIAQDMYQSELAVASGVDASRISMIETGIMIPPAEMLTRIKDALKWDASIAQIKAELA